MTDRELLQLAAKAAGIKGKWGKERYIEHREGFIPTGWLAAWDPLTDDADAFKLAVGMAMTVTVDPETSKAVAIWYCGIVCEETFTSKATATAATRRAIVRAAAAVAVASTGADPDRPRSNVHESGPAQAPEQSTTDAQGT